MDTQGITSRLKPWVNHCLFKIIKERDLVDNTTKYTNINEVGWTLKQPSISELTDEDIPATYLPREELYQRMPGIQSEWRDEQGALRKDHFRKRSLETLTNRVPKALFSEQLMKELSIPRLLLKDVEEQLRLFESEGHVMKYVQTVEEVEIFAWGSVTDPPAEHEQPDIQEAQWSRHPNQLQRQRGERQKGPKQQRAAGGL